MPNPSINPLFACFSFLMCYGLVNTIKVMSSRSVHTTTVCVPGHLFGPILYTRGHG